MGKYRNMTIPKILHLSWNNKNILESNHPLIVNGVANFKKINPDWKIEVNTDEDIDLYLRYVLSEEDYLLIKDIEIVPKSDLWRLYKLYNEGGLYMDIDRLCNIPISSVLTESTRWVLPICDYKDFSHDFMMSAPGNPVFKNTINLYMERRRAGLNSTYLLGPQTYMHGVTLTLFNEIIDSSPGEEVFKKLVDHINSIPFIETYCEKPPSDTIIYKGNILPDEWVELKKSFYKDNNLKHWTGEW